MLTSQIAMGAVLHEIRNMSAASTMMYTNLANAEPLVLGRNEDFQAVGGLLKALTNLAAAELRPGDTSYGRVDVVAVLSQLRIIVDPWFSEAEMRVGWNIAPDLPQVWGEESGLLQLFLNLAQNANKAMAASDEKQLIIEARLEGDYVAVRFRDTGPGIGNPEDLFEPFRKGMAIKGLGLFISRAIAHSFHGELRYLPEKSGSCFQVELLPLGEWQKVADKYENAGIEDQASASR
jgi:C4-dicarboxylate-specific signal transduction histidine kinase